ncbi:MAG TPA: transglutaminase-like domain-containing protein, partial [Candidatus Limnocylindrales bacterium]|nr:transglutaminase-like domain-containing protein [Candidatus Limnocylindrales bacterium]
MSAAVVPAGRSLVEEPEGLARFRPVEGWSTVIALALLSLAFGWSLDDAAWVPSPDGSTAYLPWLGVVASLLGIGLAKLGWGHLRIDLVGAIVGGLLMPLIAGNIVLAGSAPSGSPLDQVLARYQASANVAIHVWDDFVVAGQPFTTQFGHYHMIFGAMVWAAGLLGASAVMARRRPLDAVVVTGLLLLANMALTAHDQLVIMVVFSVAALTLLIRSHLLEEQLTWVRRRIGDPGAVTGLYLPGGATFVVAAVLGSLVLANVAASAPLQSAWTTLPQRLIDVSRFFEQFTPGGGDNRLNGPIGFGPSATTSGLWSPDVSRTAFVAHVPAGDTNLFKWKAGDYSTYTLYGWTWGTTHPITRGADAPLLAGTRDDPALGVETTQIQISIDPQAYVDASVVSPETIAQVDRQSTLVAVGDGNSFTTVQVDGGGSYTVDALLPKLGDTATGITEARLRAAGRNYPQDVTATYLGVPTGAIGPAAQAVLDQVEAGLGGKDAAEARPYDLAKAMQAYLRDPSHFGYATDVRDEVRRQCDGISTVECFARIREGYCEYYASEMAILLRAAGIPTRIAYGFLPGTRTADGTEIVPASAAHWWVEVYFPNSGWVEFDPTGGNGATPLPIPSGAAVTAAPRTPIPTALPEGSGDLFPNQSRGAGGGTTAEPPSANSGPFAIIGLLLLTAIVIVALAARRRGP